MLTDGIVTKLYYRIMTKFSKPVTGESRDSYIFLFTVFIPAKVFTLSKQGTRGPK